MKITCKYCRDRVRTPGVDVCEACKGCDWYQEMV